MKIFMRIGPILEISSRWALMIVIICVLVQHEVRFDKHKEWILQATENTRHLAEYLLEQKQQKQKRVDK